MTRWKNVAAAGCVVIGREGDLGLVRGHRAGDKILISPVVVADQCTASNVQPARLMLEPFGGSAATTLTTCYRGCLGTSRCGLCR